MLKRGIQLPAFTFIAFDWIHFQSEGLQELHANDFVHLSLLTPPQIISIAYRHINREMQEILTFEKLQPLA